MSDIHGNKDIIPFIKWAGGKRWLASNIASYMPVEFNNYLEPFLGGGAVYFKVKPKHAILSDVNRELIGAYSVIRSSPEHLSAILKKYQSLHSSEFYYEVRSSVTDDPIEAAARFIYLNRTCFNGLYRVNLRGEFNVPKGTKESVVMPTDDFSRMSKLLEAADIQCCDFSETIALAADRDFVFCDPPYTVKHNQNGFVKYNENIFSWGDQIRLRDSVFSAVSRGALVIVTNASHEAVRELYQGFAEEIRVSRSSVMAGNAAKRGRYEESIFVCRP